MTGATLFTTGTVSAGVVAPAQASTTAVTGAECNKGSKLWAKESVKIRKSKKLKSTSLGLWPKGKMARQASCDDSNGQAYDLCGWEKKLWTYVNYQGTNGWVPAGCTLTGKP